MKNNKGVRNLFIFGSLFFFIIFLILTVDTFRQLDKRADPITKEVNQGKMLWHKYDCIGCHTILGNGSYFAPDMTKITKKKPAGYIKKFLINPRKVNPKADMPVLGITEDEADKIVTFLDWVSTIDTNGWPPEPVLAAYRIPQIPGAAVYHNNECSACHMIGGIGGTSGPDLTHTALTRPDPNWHKSHLKDPASVVPDSPMPKYDHLSEKDINDLVEFMITLK